MSSTLQVLDDPSRSARGATALWAGAGVILLVVTVVVAQDAVRPWSPVPGVALAHSLSMAVVAGLTSVLLFGQALRGGRRGYVVLAAVYSSVSILLAGHVLVFPGALLAPTADGPARSIIGGAQSSIALFYLWHLVFILGVAASAVVIGLDSGRGRQPGLDHGIATGVALGTVPAFLAVCWVAFAPDLLPTLSDDAGTTALAGGLDGLVLGCAAAGLIATVWATRAASLIGRWLIAVSAVSLAEAVVNVGAQRYSMGWYSNRIFGFLSLSCLLVVLVLHIAKIDRATRTIAVQDSLTGVVSRPAFESAFRRDLDQAITEGSSLALLWIDLDRFKAVNDQWGHAAGDELLIEVTRRIGHEVRGSDVVARMGGDEFAVVLNRLPDHAVAEAVADRILRDLATPFALRDEVVTIGASIGITFCPELGRTAEELMRQADLAMYRVKDGGGNRVLVFDETMVETASPPGAGVGGLTGAGGLDGREAMAAAVRGREFALDAQPMIDLTDGSMRGLEVLVRWVHDGNRVPAAQFVPFAVASGQIVDVGAQVLDLIAEAAPLLLAENGPVGLLAVNLSAPELLAPDAMARLVSSPLRDYAARIVLEVGEGGANEPSTAVYGGLDQLRDLGYTIAIDGFGSGFSTTDRLEELQPEIIKTDSSLVRRAATGDPSGVRLLTWAVGVAESLGSRVVVQGVETEEEADVVRALGIDLAQGYLFGRPQPLESWTTAAPSRGPAPPPDDPPC